MPEQSKYDPEAKERRTKIAKESWEELGDKDRRELFIMIYADYLRLVKRK